MISAPDTELNTHPFVTELTKSQIKIFKDLKQRGYKKGNVYDFVYSSDKYSLKEKFIIKVSALQQEMNFKMDKIQMSYFFLLEYPYDLIWDVPYTEGEFIEFHMEAYLTHSIGFFDRILTMVNFLYELGFDEKRLRLHQMLEKLTDKLIIEILIKFDYMYKGVRKSRNIAVHSYRFDVPGLNDIISQDIYVRNKYLHNPEKGEKDYILVHKKYRKFKQKLLAEIRENNRILTLNCVELFNVLKKQFRKRLKPFK